MSSYEFQWVDDEDSTLTTWHHVDVPPQPAPRASITLAITTTHQVTDATIACAIACNMHANDAPSAVDTETCNLDRCHSLGFDRLSQIVNRRHSRRTIHIGQTGDEDGWVVSSTDASPPTMSAVD